MQNVAAQASIPIAIGMRQRGNVNLVIKEKSSPLPVNIMVFNMLGQCIKSYETNEPQLLLDGINWTKGIYMVAVKCENSQTIKKVIIN